MSPVLALYLQVFGRNPSSETSTSVAKESKGANDINENLEGIVDRMSGVQIGKDNITEGQEGKGDLFWTLEENIPKIELALANFFYFLCVNFGSYLDGPFQNFSQGF